MFSGKNSLRAEAKRARAKLSLSADEQNNICKVFFDSIPCNDHSVISAYWPIQREIDTHVLMDAFFERHITVCLPVMCKGSRVLKFIKYTDKTVMEQEPYDIAQPVANGESDYVIPDIMLVPMLAFDRRGVRLGYGGGYYDATLSALRQKQDILAVGLAYAQQACLFNLPKEEHDVPMDWIITEQGAFQYGI